MVAGTSGRPLRQTLSTREPFDAGGLGMSSQAHRFSLCLICLFVFLCTRTAFALITGGWGNDAVRGAGWPLGALEVADLKTRVGFWEGPPFGGGQYQFLY